MTPNEVNKKTNTIDKIRKEMSYWRIGGLIASLVIVGICLLILSNSVKALTQAGPSQEVYVSEVQKNLNDNLVPRMQEVASRTVTEMQPVVQAELTKLNERVPELTQASLKQVDLLQKNIPAKGEKVLDETFGKALKEQEPQIREMFPNATDEQVSALMTSLGTMATERGSKVADELLLPHTHRMQSISKHLQAIASTEPVPATEDAENWQMALAVLDILRDDMKQASTKAGATDPAMKTTSTEVKK